MAITNEAKHKALEFAVEFAQMDLQDGPPDAGPRLAALIEGDDSDIMVAPGAVDSGEAQLPYLQAELLQFLRRVVGGTGQSIDLSMSVLVVRDRQYLGAWPPKSCADLKDFQLTESVRVKWMGPARDALLYRVSRLLEDVGVGRVEMCRAPKPRHSKAYPSACGRLFVKRGRKEFCSTQCQMRTYMGRVRTEEKANEPKGGSRGTTRKR